jgi:hypothetical protein
LQQANFAALVTEAPAPARGALQQAGGYAAYGADPALAALVSRGGPLMQNVRFSGEPRGAVSLAARYAAACGAEGMLPPGLDVAAQLAALRALSQEEDARILRDARIGLSPDPVQRRAAALAARHLVDIAAIERAIAHFERGRDLESASALADYLAARRAGRWVSTASAPALAALIARAGVEREEEQTRIAAGMSAAASSPRAAETPPPQKPKGFFKRLFGG